MNLKSKSFVEMLKSITSILFLIFLYSWSAKKLHLEIFLLDNYVFNFFLLYIPSLVFFSSMFLNLEDVFKEVQRTILYSLVPIIEFLVGWYGRSFYSSFVICYAISNLILPNFKKRYPVIIFNGSAIILFLIWRV